MTSMDKAVARLEVIKRTAKGDWWERIWAEMSFAREMLAVDESLPCAEWEAAVDCLGVAFEDEGVVTRSAVLAAEAKMPTLATAAKEYKIILAAHAHIDMNWMWGYHETVSLTLETFRTMLKLMDEYPQFTFSQSQASVYRIVEKHEPAMLAEIRRRVQEGRWEVTASDWVEADKNMTSAESCIQHIIQTKTYLSELFGLPMASFDFCFEPDTFGHNANIPLILAQSGIKYYYHCRGNDGMALLHRWESPSGDSVLVYREPDWYLGNVNRQMATRLPRQCAENKSPKVGLEVYGVGDHGGGPTRMDLNLLGDMQGWPVYPALVFGKFRDFYREAEAAQQAYPVHVGEMNFIFTGCYTSQTRIKLANRVSERKLGEASALRVMANVLTDAAVSSEGLDAAWRNTLFNHFHDILPGSGVLETREYAMGLFQETVAAANDMSAQAIREMNAAMDTSVLLADAGYTDKDDSEGAGVGLGLETYGLPRVERGRGKKRAFTVYNPTASDKHELVRLTVFDWHYDKARMAVTNSKGEPVRFEVTEMYTDDGTDTGYWGHSYFDVLVDAAVKAMGYETYVLTESDVVPRVNPKLGDWRTSHVPQYVLENEHIRAEFASDSMALISLVDKAAMKELIRGAAGLHYAVEDCPHMSAWATGRFTQNELIGLGRETNEVRIHTDGLRKWLRYGVRFAQSFAQVTVSLDENDHMLQYRVRCDWREFGSRRVGVPTLRFELPLEEVTKEYAYDMPYGVVKRAAINDEVPGLSFGAALAKDAACPTVMLCAKEKYGFRGYEDTLGLALIRSSFEPDPYPENYRHEMAFAVGVSPCGCAETLLAMANGYNNGLVYAANDAHKGSLPLASSAVQMQGEGVCVDSVAPTRDGKGLVVRLYNTTDTARPAVLTLAGVTEAFAADCMEEKVAAAAVEGDRVMANVPKFGFVNLVMRR